MTAQTPRKEEKKMFAAQLLFEDLDGPGTYLSNWTGHLIRIPDEGLKAGHSPVIEILGREPMVVTKLSDDPFLPLNKARMLAADLDIEINF